MNTPLVSVIIPTYNRYEFLLKAVASVQKQTYSSIEIVVVDDASTQPEYQSLSTNLKQCKVLRLPQNSKQKFGYACTAYVRNMGASIASGEYLAFLDDDDEWLETKLQTQMEMMQKHNVPMSSTDCWLTREDGSKIILHKTYLKDTNRPSLPTIWDFETIQQHNWFITSSVVLKTEIFNQAEMFHLIPNHYSEDYDLWKRCMKICKSVFVDEPLLIYDGNHGYGRNW